MTNQEKILSRFLRQEQGAKNVVRYELRHAGKGKGGTAVESFEITEALSPEDMDTLANAIHGRAQMDADGLGPSVHRYTLTSFLADDKPTGRVAFRCRGESDLDLDGENETGEEAPTKEGLLQQLMRHNEANARTTAAIFGSTMTVMGRQYEALARQNEKLLEDRQKMLDTLESARTEQMERELVKFQEEKKQERIDYGMKKLSLLAPVALDHLTGGKVTSKDTAFSLMLKELVGSMNQDQFAAIAKTLAPEQQIVFFQLIQSLNKSAKEPKQIEEEKANGVS